MYRKSITEDHRTKLADSHRGPKAWNWKADRTTLCRSRLHSYDGPYKDWMRAVKKRDGWKCRISDAKCSGVVEAHHILSWSLYPELRYEINNGITLCRHHHPRGTLAEMMLSPFFQEMVAEADHLE